MKLAALGLCIFFALLASRTDVTYAKYSQPKSSTDEDIQLLTQKFKTILEIAAKNYPDSLDLTKVSETAFNAMLKELDPFSAYFSSQQYKGFAANNKGSTEGIGVSLFTINDTNVVISVVEGSPAESAGIKTGDKILFINGENACKLSSSDASDRLNGKEGTYVNLIVRRGIPQALIELKILRASYPIASVISSFIIDGTKAGFIKMNRFSETSDKEFIAAAEDLKKKGMKAVILDLRGNQGGYLDESCHIADQFLHGGRKITYIAGKDTAYYREFTAKEGDPLEDMPVVVLIDNQSASASEIIAGSIQDLDRGLVIGENSLGKGLVQKMWEFKDSSAFRITVARYFTPSGRCIQKPYKEVSPIIDPSMKMNMGESSYKELMEHIKKNGSKTKMDIFKTERGRSILGGGGIMPDFFAKEDTTSLLVQVMKAKGIFLDYSYRYLSDKRNELIRKYKNDASLFAADFVVSDDMLNDFGTLAKNRSAWNEKMYQADRNYIQTYVKANIAYSLWGNQGYYAVLSKLDKPVLKALELLPEAEKMAESK